jgi:hypothetical protein
MRRLLLLLPVALALAIAGIVSSVPRSQPFPHAAHAGLFPTCVGCHAGAASGDSTRLFSVGPQDCAECHDGALRDAVVWSPPRRQPTNLAFDHGAHAARIERHEDEPIDCAGCHAEPGAPRMEVRHAVVRTCIGCHAPGGRHLAYETACATCHLPLARASGLPDDRVASLPEMPGHDDPDFVLAHGELAETRAATCGTCHARESCERCHLNADRLPAVAGLESDARVARLVADLPGEWPEPPSHRSAEWSWMHADEARENGATCANCHSQQSCAACHTGGRPAAAVALPVATRGAPRGVEISDIRPPGHTPEFATRHAAAAAAGLIRCSACHSERQCVDCHAASTKPRFHALDFVMRHGAEAFARDTECAACHSSEAFCRDCHTGLGVAAAGRAGGAFHDAEPAWLLAHGLAARQDLESCVTCHEERTCLRCHSAKSGFRVSPHGPGFDPARAADRSRQSCGICHFSLPGAATP